jgi:hypothetical protein
MSRACRENKEDFEGFLGEEFNSYVDKMEQLGTWGDELTLVSPTYAIKCLKHAPEWVLSM